VDCTAIEEEEGAGSKRNILQKTLSKKNYRLRFLPRGVTGLDDRIILGNLVNPYVTRVKAGEERGRVGRERKLHAPSGLSFCVFFFFGVSSGSGY